MDADRAAGGARCVEGAGAGIQDWNASLLTLMSCPDLASKAWIWHQYDHLIMGNTAIRPQDGDAAVVRVPGGHKGLAMTSDCTPRYVQAHPETGGRQAVAEAWRNITATGARPLAVTDNMNFGNPQKPEIMGQFAGAIMGMAEACKALDFPVVSGNVSLYNETEGRPILPTPTIGAVGVIDDIAKTVGSRLTQAGLGVILIGETKGWLGQSLYLRELRGREEGAPPPGRSRGRAPQRRLRARPDRRRAGSPPAMTCRMAACWSALAEMCIAGGTGPWKPPCRPERAFRRTRFSMARIRPAISSPPARATMCWPRRRRPACRRSCWATRAVPRSWSRGWCRSRSAEIKTAHEDWLPTYMNATE